MWQALAQIGGQLLDTGVQVWNAREQQMNAEDNLALQRETFEYNKQMQKEAWNREDNAVARRVADLKASGLSPVLAAGSAASASSPVKQSAPQIDPYAGHNIKTNFAQMLPSIISLASQVKNLQQQDATIAKTRSEQMAIDAQVDRTRAGTEMERLNISSWPLRQEILALQRDYAKGNLTSQELNQRLSQLDSDIRSYNLGRSRDLGIRTNDPTTLRGLGVNAVYNGLQNMLNQIGADPSTHYYDNRNYVPQQLFGPLINYSKYFTEPTRGPLKR